MNKFIVNYCLLFLTTISMSFQGCTFDIFSKLKKNNYKIINTENLTAGSFIRCIVFEKNSNIPLEDAIVFIEGDSTHEITKSDGSALMKVKTGNSKINVIYLNTRITTKNIRVMEGEKVTIRFNVYIPIIW